MLFEVIILSYLTRALDARGIGAQAVEAVKEYARRMGATRIIVGSGARRTAGFFAKCGFKRAFSEEVLFVDIK